MEKKTGAHWLLTDVTRFAAIEQLRKCCSRQHVLQTRAVFVGYVVVNPRPLSKTEPQRHFQEPASLFDVDKDEPSVLLYRLHAFMPSYTQLT